MLFVNNHVNLKILLQQGISNQGFFGDLVYEFKKIFGNSNFSDLFKKTFLTVSNIMRQTACLGCNTIMVDSNAELFSSTAMVQVLDSVMASI